MPHCPRHRFYLLSTLESAGNHLSILGATTHFQMEAVVSVRLYPKLADFEAVLDLMVAKHRIVRHTSQSNLRSFKESMHPPKMQSELG